MTTPPGPLVAVAGGICTCPNCEHGARGEYRMIGKCTNCTADPILMLFRIGDQVRTLRCPLCGVGTYCDGVRAYRRATAGETPEAIEGEPARTG